jgi:hypothetical protein
MEITAKTITGNNIRLNVKGSTTIYEVKQSIHAKFQSYNPDDFKLSFAGKPMDDLKCLAEYCVQHESVIFIVRIYVYFILESC